MTRVNFGIPVKCLTDEHLLAEHREIKRLPDSYLSALRSGSINRIPKKFCLGAGHVLFFVDKPAYTLRRYLQIYRECLRRGFNVQSYEANWGLYPVAMFSKTTRSTSESKKLLLERISERIKASPKECFHYYGEQISKSEAIKLLRILK